MSFLVLWRNNLILEYCIWFSQNDFMFTNLILTLSLPNVSKGKFRPNFQISFSKILRNKWHHVKVPAETFHLNGHIKGFRP